MNDFISFGLHRLWKKQACQILEAKKKERVLDLATGTGDLAFYLEELSNNLNLELEITAVDFSKEMLKIAESKKQRKNSKVNFVKADIMNLNFENESFDRIIISYGLRNIKNYQKGLKEIYRISSKNSRLVILDLSYPNQFFEKLTEFYRFKILPLFGKFLTQDQAAYEYLVNSIYFYLNQEELKELLEKTNWQKVKYKNLFGGLSVIHSADKFSL